jgi:LmbE family N-acetylglucosaminyl deacetylase
VPATFSPSELGAAEAAWQQSRLNTLPCLPAPGADDVVVVVAAHPDDESLGAGGLIATATARGAQVRVVVATHGEASHPESLSHRPDQLAELRQTEAHRAVAALGVSGSPVFLALPDGQLSVHRSELESVLAELIADATLVVSTWCGDGHPDHDACADAVGSLAAASGIPHWQYPIWAWHWAAPDGDQLPWERMRRLVLDGAARNAKRTAVRAYRSQVTELSATPGDEPVLPTHVLAHFDRDFETFVVDPHAPAAHTAYFDALYAAADDPWGLADRFYERRKRDLLLAALPRERFGRAFEPGCANGEITARLVERCDHVVAWDVAAAAVQRTRVRCGNRADVDRGRVPDEWPSGRFDLIVLSEVGYYCADLKALAARVAGSLTADGVVVACHWRRAAPDHPHSGDRVHEVLNDGLAGLCRIVRHVEPDFLLDVWSCRPDSVAQLEGILR